MGRARVQRTAGMGVDLANVRAVPCSVVLSMVLDWIVGWLCLAWRPRSYPCCPLARAAPASVCTDLHMVGLAQPMLVGEEEGVCSA